jgi:polyhydroxybutyrate depolymerase
MYQETTIIFFRTLLMRRNGRRLRLGRAGILVFAAACIAGPLPAVAEPRPARNLSQSLQVGNQQRRYLLQVPRAYSPDHPLPLLFVFHGGNGTASEMQKISRFNLLSAEKGILIVYPDSLSGYWNDGRLPESSQQDLPDDISFVTHVVAKLSATYAVDLRRVYAVGFSNGGMMTLRLPCALPGLFAGIAAVAASFPRTLAAACEPSEPISLLMVNGTADTVVPWEGGDADGPSRNGGLFLPVQETAKFWARRGGCREQPVRTQQSGLDIKNALFVHTYRFSGCRAGIEVMLEAVGGLGHQWPGPTIDPLLDVMIHKATGSQYKAQDVTRSIWDFLSRQQRPAVPTRK